MSNIAIKAENLSKAYQLGEIGTGTISRDLERWYARIRGKEDPFLKIGEANHRDIKSTSDVVWSLKDINFEIEQGDAVGIIGRNGAGKSTLLKVLSRVTSPTSGRITGKGRIASLLEVGTGFHPDLTGRENIYLNGAILGMRKKEITRKFDEIVDFAGVERYIDTPVKRYSSGMYVRLAFAVAAHLESEILIVDEVLAVGDAEFQKKCLGKMGDVSKGEGRTVLFVSHNMQAITALCSKGLFLKNGHSSPISSSSTAISNYLSDNQTIEDINFPIIKDDIIIHEFSISQDGLQLQEFVGEKPIRISIKFELLDNLSHFRIGFFVKHVTGELVNRSLIADWNENLTSMSKGTYIIEGDFPEKLLNTGSYLFQIHSSRYGIKDYGLDHLTSRIVSINAPLDYNRAYLGETIFGTFLVNPNWSLNNV